MLGFFVGMMVGAAVVFLVIVVTVIEEYDKRNKKR